MRWPMLLSALLHLLVVLTLSLFVTPAGGSHLAQENPSIRVPLSYTDKVDESPKTEVSSESPSSGHKSDRLRAHLVPESEASFAPKNDLNEYAKLRSAAQDRSSRPLSGLDSIICLNSTDISYLSSFVYIKHKIEQVSSYSIEAVAGQMQGQLLLLFVLQCSGQVKANPQEELHI